MAVLPGFRGQGAGLAVLDVLIKEGRRRGLQILTLDAQTHAVVKRFENVGDYPWSVTIPLGQNYCH